MTLSLVPPTEEVNLDALPEEQARALLTKMESPALDHLRSVIPRMRTSEIIAQLANVEIVAHGLSGDAVDDTHGQMLTMAAMLSLADELDRRIPIP